MKSLTTRIEALEARLQVKPVRWVPIYPKEHFSKETVFTSKEEACAAYPGEELIFIEVKYVENWRTA